MPDDDVEDFYGFVKARSAAEFYTITPEYHAELLKLARASCFDDVESYLRFKFQRKIVIEVIEPEKEI